MIRAASPNQEGVEGTSSEEVWIITAPSGILVICASLKENVGFFLLKKAHFYLCLLQVRLVAHRVGRTAGGGIRLLAQASEREPCDGTEQLCQRHSSRLCRCSRGLLFVLEQRCCGGQYQPFEISETPNVWTCPARSLAHKSASCCVD